MYIEDLLVNLSRCRLNTFDLKVVNSLHWQVYVDCIAFTEKQSQLAIKICKKYRNQLEKMINMDLDLLLSAPQFKYSVRPSVSAQYSVSYITEPKKAFKVSFPYNENIVAYIKNHAKTRPGSYAKWDSDAKAWMLSPTEGNLELIKNYFIPNNFLVDESISGMIEKYDEIVKNIENFVPSVILENGKVSYKNVYETVPPLNTNNLLEALFTARQYGITTWNDDIENHLETIENPVTTAFLRSKLGNKISFDSETLDVEHFSDIVRYVNKILIIVPAFNELAYVKKWYNFLSSQGFSSDEMVVLFRLDGKSVKTDFNDFVKEQGLNKSLNDQQRIFFVSLKLPKPLIKQCQKFGAIINLGSGHAPHYTLQNLLVDHHDVITYNKK